MKDFTRFLKEEYKKDHGKIFHHNNSKWDKMTDTQRLQAVEQKRTTFISKWQAFEKQATTTVQASICTQMLVLIGNCCR